jgi:cell division septum initiation protein DivIVA
MKMTEMLRRDELIAILNRLGSDEDEEVLAAARQAHARIAASGMSWEDLLVPDGSAAESDEAADESDEPAGESDEPAGESDEAADESDEAAETEDGELEAGEDEAPAERAGAEGKEKDTESLALIGELLARSDISEELRAELAGYKTDIAENEFVEADRRYLRAVRQRLKK